MRHVSLRTSAPPLPFISRDHAIPEVIAALTLCTPSVPRDHDRLHAGVACHPPRAMNVPLLHLPD